MFFYSRNMMTNTSNCMQYNYYYDTSTIHQNTQSDWFVQKQYTQVDFEIAISIFAFLFKR